MVAGEIGTFISDCRADPLPQIRRLPDPREEPARRIRQALGVWYVQLSYGADGGPRLLVMATQRQPGASVDAQPSDARGRIRLTNDKVPGSRFR